MWQAEPPATAGQAEGSAGGAQCGAEACALPGFAAGECRAAAECRALLLRLVDRYDKQARTARFTRDGVPTQQRRWAPEAYRSTSSCPALASLLWKPSLPLPWHHAYVVLNLQHVDTSLLVWAEHRKNCVSLHSVTPYSALNANAGRSYGAWTTSWRWSRPASCSCTPGARCRRPCRRRPRRTCPCRPPPRPPARLARPAPLGPPPSSSERTEGGHARLVRSAPLGPHPSYADRNWRRTRPGRASADLDPRLFLQKRGTARWQLALRRGDGVASA